jgi:hypothetical protein
LKNSPLHHFCVVFEEKAWGAFVGEGLAEVEGRSGDRVVAELHDPELSHSDLVLFRFCAGSR